MPAAVLKEAQEARRSIVVARDGREDAAGEVSGVDTGGCLGFSQGRHRRGDCSTLASAKTASSIAILIYETHWEERHRQTTTASDH